MRFLSNIAIVDDLERPLTTPKHPVFYYLFAAFHIFVKREAKQEMLTRRSWNGSFNELAILKCC